MIPFSEVARSLFDDMAADHGMRCVAINEYLVRYENGLAFLCVRYDNGRSYEVGVEIGQLSAASQERPFSLAEILKLAKQNPHRPIDGLMAASPDGLFRALEQLSILAGRFAAPFLDGNEFAFARVAKLRMDESLAYAQDRDLREARTSAEKAWKAKDYPGVVAALKPVELLLSPLEAKRLSYARAKIGA